jgi:hypothetical protein
MFGTYRVPGLPITPLGVTFNMGNGVLGQLLYPFKSSSYRAPQNTTDKSKLDEAITTLTR